MLVLTFQLIRLSSVDGEVADRAGSKLFTPDCFYGYSVQGSQITIRQSKNFITMMKSFLSLA